MSAFETGKYRNIFAEIGKSQEEIQKKIADAVMFRGEVDEDLMDAANIIENEKVYVVNNNNGERFETYVIKGERKSGVICTNGAAARKVQPGDILIITAYAQMEFEEAKKFKPSIIHPDSKTNLL